MSSDTIDLKQMVEHIAKVKAAWRAHARQLSWEDKVAAIERMWERERHLKEARQTSAQAE